MKKFCFRLTLAVCFVAAVSSIAFAQRGGGRGGQGGFGGGRGGFGGPGGFGGGRGGSTEFVLREDVQKELGLSEKKVEDLRAVIDEIQQEARESRGNLDFRNMSEDERADAFAEMRENSAKAAKKARKAITAELSSKQKARYAELEVQYLVQQGNLSGALQAAGEDVSDSEQEKLNEAMQEVREEVRRRTAEITRELYIEALSKVSDANVEKLMGKAFAFESTRGRGGGNAGRGGRQRGGDAAGGTARRARPSGADDESNPRRASRGGDANPRRSR